MGALALGAKMFRIETSSWCIFPLMNMKCPFPSLLITFGSTSILLYIRTTTPVSFLSLFAFHHLIVYGVGLPGCPWLEQASQEAGVAVCPRLEQVSWEAG